MLCICSSVGRPMGCSQVLAEMNNPPMHTMYKNLFESQLSIPLSIHHKVELLDHVVILFLTFFFSFMVAAMAYRSSQTRD